MGRPFYAVIIPLGEGGHPDNSLPGGGNYPDQGLPGGGYYPDQGLPGRPPRPSHPIAPGGRPVDPGYGWGGGEHPSTGPVRPGRPVDPGFGWGGGERPGHPIAPGGGYPVDPGYGRPEGRPDQGLPGGPVGPVHPWVPPEGEQLPPPPEEIAHNVVVAVWRPNEQAWSVAVGEGPSPAPTD